MNMKQSHITSFMSNNNLASYTCLHIYLVYWEQKYPSIVVCFLALHIILTIFLSVVVKISSTLSIYYIVRVIALSKVFYVMQHFKNVTVCYIEKEYWMQFQF